MTTKPSDQLTLRDRLSHLNFEQACKLLGPEGKRLLSRGSTYEFDDLARSLVLQDDLFRLKFPHEYSNGKPIIVTMTMMASARDRLHFNCTLCGTTCEHVAAAFSLVLEEKLLLGLSEAPPERIPIESLSERELVERALDERRERAEKERFRLTSSDPAVPWTDYVISSAASGKSYRLALRGEERGESYCSCPDFRSNTLGTCKHIIYALSRINSKFTQKDRNKKYRNRNVFVHLQYGRELSLHLRLPDKPSEELVELAGKLSDKPIGDVRKLVRTLDRLERAGYEP
ncbi:MAG TPA: SWIM zinc finger family protein, partial [Planctomycetaceae bacterium]|nr:SWIM zinc finger family protein [Planctomycetaceae bacterium]